MADLTNLLRRDQKPDLQSMIRRVTEGFRFLSDLTEAEKTIAGDVPRKNRGAVDALIATLAS